MTKNTLMAAAALGLVAGTAQAGTIDFEGFANGDVIDQVAVDGVTATVTVDSNGAVDEAIAFDTSGVNDAADPDLTGPFEGTGDPNPGNILVISEGGATPDDERLGGTVTFSFDAPVDLISFDAYDGGFFQVESAKGDAFLQDSTMVPGDNMSSRLDVPGFFGVSFLTFTFADSGEGASGGIDNIVVEPSVIPVPAALPLMLAGLGGLALVRRRRG